MKIINFLVYGNVLVAFSAGSLAFSFSDYNSLENPILYGFFLFFGTLFIYNIQRLLRFKEISKNTSLRHYWIKKNKNTLFIMLFFSGFGALLTLLFLRSNISALIILFFAGVLSLLYAFRFDTKKRTVRELPYLKIHLIAISWTLLAFAWPIINSSVGFEAKHIWYCVALYFYIVGITIPFDIRDLPFDSPAQKTIPQVVGVKRSKVIGVVMLVISGVIIVVKTTSALYNPLLYIAYGSQLFFIYKTRITSKELLFSGGIDGSILFLAFFFYYL